MTSIDPKIGEEYMLIGEDFINGFEFFTVISNIFNGNRFTVRWNKRIHQTWWGNELSTLDFTGHWWDCNSFQVVKIESEQQKLMLLIKHG